MPDSRHLPQLFYATGDRSPLLQRLDPNFPMLLSAMAIFRNFFLDSRPIFNTELCPFVYNVASIIMGLILASTARTVNYSKLGLNGTHFRPKLRHLWKCRVFFVGHETFPARHVTSALCRKVDGAASFAAKCTNISFQVPITTRVSN